MRRKGWEGEGGGGAVSTASHRRGLELHRAPSRVLTAALLAKRCCFRSGTVTALPAGRCCCSSGSALFAGDAAAAAAARSLTGDAATAAALCSLTGDAAAVAARCCSSTTSPAPAQARADARALGSPIILAMADCEVAACARPRGWPLALLSS